MNNNHADLARDDFALRMRTLAPPAKFSDEDKHTIKLHLHYYMRARSRRMRNRLAAPALVLATLLLMPMGRQLIGVDFNMTRIDSERGGGAGYESYDGRARLAIPADMESNDVTAGDAAPTFNQLYESGEIEISSMTGWQVGSHKIYFHHYSSVVDGKTYNRTRNYGKNSRESVKAVLQYISTNEEKFLGLKNQGGLPKLNEGTAYQAGAYFQVYSWTHNDPKYGHIKYYEGTPLDR
jgi:hypothetical protein